MADTHYLVRYPDGYDSNKFDKRADAIAAIKEFADNEFARTSLNDNAPVLVKVTETVQDVDTDD